MASGEEKTGELQMKNLVTPDLDKKTIAAMDDAQPALNDQPLVDVDIAPEAKGSYKRVREPHDSISKRELKMLLDSSPVRKRQRSSTSSDSALYCKRQ
jgi:hypothetical protein